jgi:cobalt-zinc-cadmium efflux system membrane fusion protein
MVPHIPTAELPTGVSAPSGLPGQNLAAPRKRWVVGIGVILGVIALSGLSYWFREPMFSVFAAPVPKLTFTEEPLQVLGKDQISVASGSRLHNRLKIAEVKRQELDYPLLNVTGYVMARLAPGSDLASSRWDFASPEVATAYGDWLHARADVVVLEKQAEKTRSLVEVQVQFYKAEFARKEKGFSMAAVPERDLVASKAEYLKAEIQGQKDITEAVSALKKAERNRGLLERQLLQAGVDPEVIREAKEGLVLIVAEVPEMKISLVKIGLPCEAKFFGVPDQLYHGKVGRLGPSVAKEKRTLRVTFEVPNLGGKLLPGMFAEIGLGAESRRLLTVPVEAVLHADNADYVMKEETSGRFRAVKVTVDEPRQTSHHNGSHGNESCIPVIDGLHEGERVVGDGAILLKPMLVKAIANH